MNSKLVTVGCLTMVGLLLTVGGGVADADINTQGNICEVSNPDEVVEHNTSGVENPTAIQVTVECAIPRPTIPSNAPTAFVIDGANFRGASTGCSLFVSDFSGNFRFSESLPVLSGASSHIFFSFAAGRVSSLDHVTLLCALPANRGGRISGVTAVGP